MTKEGLLIKEIAKEGLPIKEIAILAAVAIGGYFIYKMIKPISDVSGAVGGALGSQATPAIGSIPAFNWGDYLSLLSPLTGTVTISNKLTEAAKRATSMGKPKTPVSEPEKIELIGPMGSGVVAQGYVPVKTSTGITAKPAPTIESMNMGFKSGTQQALQPLLDKISLQQKTPWKPTYWGVKK